jgi:hypothetical protein
MLVSLLTIALFAAPPVGSSPIVLKPAKVLQHLTRAVQAQDTVQIERAVRALVVLGEKSRARVRREIRRHRSPVFAHVLEALSQMSPKMRLLAAPLLRTRDPKVRIRGAKALNGSSLSLLKRAYTKERDLNVKVALLRSISESDHKNTVGTLVAAFSASESRLRIQALAGLLVRRERSVLSAVHTLLRDSDPGVRASAIRFLSVLGNRGSVAALVIRAHAEDDKDLLTAIWSALESMTGESLGNDLKAWQRWLDTET